MRAPSFCRRRRLLFPAINSICSVGMVVEARLSPDLSLSALHSRPLDEKRGFLIIFIPAVIEEGTGALHLDVTIDGVYFPSPNNGVEVT
jgi:hypothetical protein